MLVILFLQVVTQTRLWAMMMPCVLGDMTVVVTVDTLNPTQSETDATQ
jgi:hypothetical protein